MRSEATERPRMRIWAAALIMALVGAGVAAPRPAMAGDTLVFAAASLRNALDAVAGDFKAQTGKQVTVSYAASSTLAKQIEQGATADIYISADLDWMDYLQKKDLVRTATRRNLPANALVLVAPKGGPHVSAASNCPRA